MKYVHTPDMGEISGFGGGYEETCQRMLNAAVTFLLETKPEANPKYHGFKDVFGLCCADNDDAKELDKIVEEAAGGDLTGAMHHTVIQRALWIRKNSWEAYCKELFSGKKQ